MNHITIGLDPGLSVLVLSGIPIALAGFFTFFLAFNRRWLAALGAACMVAGFATSFTTLGIHAPKGEEAKAAAIDAFEVRYGVQLTEEQLFTELGYPFYAPESGTSQVYGTVTLDVGDGWRQVALAWKNDKMLLVAVDDAGAGQELERR
ncbi:hypothetical protein [Microbacterium sp. 77mftsu3.1]|uniref:hypothetical protein n=1 Tax=Microbacterium sp. 77mftsu3.1 TaxID=1761802 RepID=UPI00037DBA92|nr:hypothetical protein [Microbacterium sp. 77mftsu3.1]SDH47939.1 hypothetical protein SAMN04488590_3397 [Microbacterium sp. 77mftsu3.1]